MEITLVRNATLNLNYGGQHILIDPFFASKHAYPSFTGQSENPTVDLPMAIEDIIAGIDFVIVSHLHRDHFDVVAQEKLSKTLPLYCQPGNEDKIKEADFTNVTPITDSIEVSGITITRTGGHHGLGAVENVMGSVSGFVLAASGEPTVYITGDTVICDEVSDTVRIHQPDVIVMNCGGAQWNDPENEGQRVYILMETSETIQLAQLATEAKLVAVHLESLDHCTVSRTDLRAAADAANITANRLFIPADGETLIFN